MPSNLDGWRKTLPVWGVETQCRTPFSCKFALLLHLRFVSEIICTSLFSQFVFAGQKEGMWLTEASNHIFA